MVDITQMLRNLARSLESVEKLATAVVYLMGVGLLVGALIDLKTMGDLSRIKSAKMDVRIRNTFPLGAKLQMNLLDDQLNFIESLDIDPQDQIIEACEVDAKGYPLDAVETVFTLGLGKEKMAALKSAKFIAITTTLVGSGKMMKIYDVSSISVSTTVDFEYEAQMGR